MADRPPETGSPMFGTPVTCGRVVTAPEFTGRGMPAVGGLAVGAMAIRRPARERGAIGRLDLGALAVGCRRDRELVVVRDA